jgi:hypothetical protein
MGLKFRRGTTAQQSGSLAFGEPYVNTTLGTLVVGGATGDIVLSAGGTGSTGNFGPISGSGLDITGNANIAGNVTVGGRLQIGDATSDTVNVVASLSSSLIPQTTNVFDLGSATRIWRDLYISTGSIKFVDGTTVVKELSLSTITGLESSTGSSNVSLTNLNTTTASLNISVSNLNTTTASLTQRVAANEAVSGTFARTNSANTFTGNQTVSGSLFVSQDLVVAGSSSIQNISSSNLIIGAEFITLNTATPGARYAGLQIVDSGSVGGSGSFLYDAVQDEFIFVHRGNGTNITSSHFILGPETIDNLGNETYLTNNRLPKGTGKEHLVDSNISDDGTTVNITGALTVTGNITGPIRATNGLVSGSSQITLQSTTGFTAYDTALATITGSLILSASNDASKFATLATYTGSNDTTNTTQNSRLDQLSTASGSAITRLTALEVETSNLESTTASLNISVSNLNSFSSSQLSKDSTLATYTGSVNTSLSNLNSATASLSTTSNVRFGSLGIGMAATGTAGRIDAANDIVAFSTSDIRLKENITPIPNAIEKIRKISGNTYDWKAELKDVHGYEGNDVGVIAQEVEAVLPQLVQDRDNGYKAVKYDKLVALLIEGIKEQQQHIDNLTIQVEELKKQKGL